MTVFPDAAVRALTAFDAFQAPGVGPVSPTSPAMPLGGFPSKGTYLRSQVFGR